MSYKHQLTCERFEIEISASNKASPWQNGFMKRWFGTFKREFGKLNQFKDLSELHEAIAIQIYYYNHKRIHLTLGMSPAQYAKTLKV